MQRIIRVARGCLGVLVVLVVWPLGAAQGANGKSDPGGPDPTCAQVLDGKPGWELKQETVPAAGSEVHANQVIEALMTWDTTDFADAPLYHALDCVTVDGRLRTGLSLDEQQTPNDGEVTHQFEVPAGLMIGTEICSRGAIAGDGNGYFELNPSNDACFTVVESDTPPEPPPVCTTPPGTPPDEPGSCTPQPPPVCESPPGTPPDAPGSCTPQPPPVCESPPGTPPDASGSCSPPPTPPSVVPPPSPPVTDVGASVEEPRTATEEAGPPPPEVGGVSDGLPRTGHPERPLILSAGLLLALGGAALTGAVKRPVRAGRGAARP